MSVRAQAAILALVLTVIAVLVGIRTGNKVLDTDEAVYQRTLLSMRTGQGYYSAMADAVAVKEGARPNSVRAIRPPTMFLVLRWFPEGSWRWIVGLVFLAAMIAMARLAEPYGRWAPLIAVVAGGVWVIGASSYLYLHAELWGLPFFLWGLVLMRKDDQTLSATLIALATVIRELYGVGLILALLLGKERRKWIPATTAVVGLAVAHVILAHGVLAPTGHEVALGNEPLTLRSILRFISPGDRPAAFALGTAMLLAGFIGLARNLRDQAARVLLLFAIVMLPAGIVTTRAYWNLTYGPAISAFIGAAWWQVHESASKYPHAPG